MTGDSAAGAWLATEFSTRIGQVLESMTGEAPSVQYEPHQVSETDLDTGEQGLLWWEQPFSLSAESLVWVAANREAWDGIGGRVLRSAGVDEVDAESARSTYLEIVTQTLSGIAGAVSARVRHEVSCGSGKPAAPASSAAGGVCFSFRIVFPDAELAILVSFANNLANIAEEPEPVQEPSAAPAAKPASAAAFPPNAIDLLLDVELPVSVSFGRAQLALKDVIKLTTGSIVELNRSISEPVEVIVNNCVIARGEVVVVEGNFGIRIKHVVSRQERLRTLH
jgi:flagellar motor switch protein FliN